jgi:hypothetical protein
MMQPLAQFTFSQSSLQDYVDCRRRFQLRYIQRVSWPAVQAEPARENEQHIQRGERFHRLVQQYLVGVPADRLSHMAQADPDTNLLRWWENFLSCIPGDLKGTRCVEARLSAPLGRFRLVAQYDLVLIQPDGCAVIYDWKTSPHRPKRSTLLERLQTHVYPYLLAQAGAALNNGRGIDPGAIQMIYWFTEPGDPPEYIPYSLSQCQSDGQYLLSLVNEIGRGGFEECERCSSETPCRYCVFRSLCDRGTQAGALTGAEDYDPDAETTLDFDLEQIGEIRF